MQLDLMSHSVDFESISIALCINMLPKVVGWAKNVECMAGKKDIQNPSKRLVLWVLGCVNSPPRPVAAGDQATQEKPF